MDDEQEITKTLNKIAETLDLQRCLMLSMARKLQQAGMLDGELQHLWVRTWDCNSYLATMLGMPVRSADQIIRDSDEIHQLRAMFGEE